MRRLYILVTPVLVLALVLSTIACGGGATPTPVPTPAATATPVRTPTPTPTPPAPGVTPQATQTPIFSATPTIGPSPTPIRTATPGPASSPTPTPKPIILKLAHGYAPGSFVDQIVQLFKDKSTEYTNGRVQVQIFPMATLVTDAQLFDATSTGIIDIGWPSDWVIQPVIPDWYLQWLIWWWDGYDQVKAFFQHPDGGQKMLAKLEKYNIKGLFMVPNSAYSTMLITKNKEVKSFFDLKGMKIRGITGIPAVPYSYVGSASITIPQVDALNAFEQGLVDAMGTDADAVISFGYYKSAKYAFVFPYFIFALRTMMVNLTKWNSIPADVQNIINKKVVPEVTEWTYANLEKNEKDAVKKLSTLGMVVNIQTEAEKKQLRDAVYPLTEKYWSQIDPAFIKLAESLRPAK